VVVVVVVVSWLLGRGVGLAKLSRWRGGLGAVCLLRDDVNVLRAVSN